MPPPELLERAAPASVGALVLEHLRAEVPMPRHSGPPAEEARLRAELAEARALADADGERNLAITLARLLASRGRDLGTATRLARRALLIADDPALRTELAGWLAGLGDAAAAAEVLRDLARAAPPAEAARALVKIAVLLARSGDAAAAAEALDEAAGTDVAEAMAIELFGTLAAWAPETVAPEGAAAAYLEAARRRADAGEQDAAFEDRLRAFDLAPHDPGAAESIAEALAARDMPGAADEARRISATAAREVLGQDPAPAHRRRMLSAVKDGDASRAVAAMIDAGLEGEIDGEDASKVDEALALAGLHELLAARFELRAERAEGAARGEAWQALATLYAGPMASPERATDAWIEALAAHPENAAARAALRDQAAAGHDPAPLAEGLLRAALGLPETSPARRAALRELGVLADGMGDAALASFAWETLGDEGGDEVRPDRAGLAARAQQQDEDLAEAQRALETAEPGEARVGVLRRIAAAYQGRPAEVGELVATLAEIARAAPSDRGIAAALARAARRAGDGEALENALRERLEAGLPRPDVVRARLDLAVLLAARGHEADALAEARAALGEVPGHRAAAGAALLFATRLGAARDRAEALVELAQPSPPPLRAGLLAAAAEIHAALGSEAAARSAAEHACEADPTGPRALSTLAMLATRVAEDAAPAADRVGAAAIERAMTTVLPRSVWCERLAASFDDLGEPDLALAWTQRWLALRPGSAEAMALFLKRASAARDPAKIADAIGWVLAQPRPLADFAEALSEQLGELLELDRARARILARRALDVVGPRVPLLRARLLDLSARAADPGLAIAVLERYLAAETLGAAAGEILLELSRRRTDAGDYDGAAREIARAAQEGGAAESVLEHVGNLEGVMREAGAWLGSDGLCALAEARALGLAALPEGEKAAATAFRELGSLLWDLANDTRGAEEAFFRACELSPEGGVERYARDLCAFAGDLEAIDVLSTRAARASEAGARRLAANLLLEAAKLSTEHGMPERALLAAAQAIENDPSRADAVAFVEKNAHVDGGLAVLDRTYDLLAAATLGCFGRRAAHYRGARQLERRGAIDLALRHAAACFEAVPSEGTSYVLMTRLAERAGDPTEAVRAVERVAEAADPGAKPLWLKRAAAIAGTTEEGLRTRFGLLLRALNARPEPGTVADVAASIRALAAAGGEGDAAPDMVRMRFERAVKASLPKLDGPDGARTAVEMARIASELGVPSLAFAALTRAANVDGDIDEFATLAPLVPSFAADAEAARRWVDGVRASADKPYSSVGAALLRLAALVAGALGDAGTRAALSVQAVKRAPEDDVLLEEAHVAVTEHGDADFFQKLDGLVPPEERVAAWLRLSEAHERDGREAEAIAALERAIASGLLDRASHERAAARLGSLLDRAGRDDAAEALLRARMARTTLPPAAHARTARDLADLLLRRDDRQGAFEVLADLAGQGPPDPELLAAMRGLARATSDLTRYAEVLSSAAERTGDALARLEILRELAPLYGELGEHEQAAARYQEIAALDPADVQALELLERAANENGDHEAIAELIGRRIALTPAGDKRRMLRLRRAAVLEQRLGRLDDAARELDLLLGETADDLIALRFLADIHERRGAPLDAARLLQRLGELASTTDEKAEYGLRGAAAHIAAGDIDRADAALDAVAAIAAREEVLELRVEIWRRRGDARALSEALEQLAASSREPADRRAAMLLDAARAASALGDDAGALDRARRALKLAPALPDAVLEARRLEYRAGGTGTPREAQAAATELQRIESKLDPSQIELHAFLLAEALDAIQGGGAGMRELTRRHAEVGPMPLIALGMAERMVRAKSFEPSLPLFERALAGDLRGLRNHGRVALAAAEAATAAEAYTLAARLLDVAAAEPETQLLAQRRQLELAASLGEPEIAKQALAELLRQSTGLDRARVLLSLGKLVSAEDPERAAKLLADAAPLAAADKALAAQLAEATARLDAQRAQPEPEPPATSARAVRVGSDPTRSLEPPRVTAPSAPTPAAEPPPASVARPAVAEGEESDDQRLHRELAQGSFEAGEQIVAAWASRPGGAQEIFAVRRQQAQIRPGDAAVLHKLVEAALADGNAMYARALEHVIHALDAEPPPAPPLAAQRLAPDLVAALLFRTVADSAVHEALSLVLDTGLYRRDVGQYQLTGVARVQPGGGSALGDVHGAVARLFGHARTALFHQRTAATPAFKIALLAPPAIVLTGEVKEETPELRYLLGAALAGAMPEHALVNALNEEALRTLVDALHAAFGPVAQLPRGNAAVARLGQNLWQLVPPRADRRLRDLFADPAPITYEAAVAGTRQAMRRAGLFASGSLAATLAQVAPELSLPIEVFRASPTGLADACAAHAEIADLVKLAVRMEFAEARWAPAAGLDRRRLEGPPRSQRW